ncbi:MAG TPA: hypothetical protein VLZ81_00315 [Blastocatellia bacterium]|nr:hypothetical protein [Blastocatellia bacterium]
MTKVRIGLAVIALMAMMALLSPLAWRAGFAQTRKDKWGTPIPDVSVLTIQFLDRAEPDGPGNINPIAVKALLRNNTDDRVVTGVLWKIQVKDGKTGKVVEVLHPYTSENSFNRKVHMSIPPHSEAEISFFILRTVHTENRRESTVEPENYVYKPYDKDKDRLTQIEYYGVDAWPFKGRTDPVLVAPAKN